MKILIDDPFVKKQSHNIFLAANEFYPKFYTGDGQRLTSDDANRAFERIHEIALKVGDLDILDFSEHNNFSLVPILVAYVRAMLIDRFPCHTDALYKTEYYIFAFIYLYVQTMNPIKTRLLQPALLIDASESIVENLFHFRYNGHGFNRMCVNLVVKNLFLYNRLYEAEQNLSYTVGWRRICCCYL